MRADLLLLALALSLLALWLSALAIFLWRCVCAAWSEALDCAASEIR